MSKMNQIRPEVDTHKVVLAQREQRKQQGRKRHDNKGKQRDTKWFDHYN